MSVLTPEDMAVLRAGAKELQQGDPVQVALGALVRSCTTHHAVVPPHLLGTLCAVAERMRERCDDKQMHPVPRVELNLEALPAHELFALPIGGQFIVRWAKDDNHEDGYRLPYVRQVISSIDAAGDILTEDGYEWQKREITREGSNELDTGRGIAHFFRYDPARMKLFT